MTDVSAIKADIMRLGLEWEGIDLLATLLERHTEVGALLQEHASKSNNPLASEMMAAWHQINDGGLQVTRDLIAAAGAVAVAWAESM
ncbi:hypothetical protein GCM10011609_57240 [Lentzea pudingi]|uniref:Uncharacterized protein n=1 Tax=Lentzea pudingi TaxID=1789439 RepID=A0ABQ2IG16_9PSEU|nr:hypothetical protein GCM10011609_57240 [Lentzea pudingi]